MRKPRPPDDSTDWVDTIVDELFAPLKADQQLAVDLTADAFFTNDQRWPTFQYVELRLEENGHDAKAVIGSFPIAGTSARYAAFRSTKHAGSLNDDNPVELTLLGFHHYKGPFALNAEVLIRDALLFLQIFVDARRTFRPPATEVKQLQVTSNDALEKLAQARHSPYPLPKPAVLANFVQVEPPLAASAGGSSDGTKWIWNIWHTLLDFDGVADIEDYVRRIVARFHVPRAAAVPVLTSPLSLPTSLGYLDTAWRVMEGRESQLVFLPSPERAASLAFDVATREEYLDRLSALGDVLKSINVPPGVSGKTPLTRLRAYLEGKLPRESHERLGDAFDRLWHVTNIRNGGTHAESEPLALEGYKVLGITYPVTSPGEAWNGIRIATIQAIDIIREEILSYVGTTGPAPSVAKGVPAKRSRAPSSSTSRPSRRGHPAPS